MTLEQYFVFSSDQLKTETRIVIASLSLLFILLGWHWTAPCYLHLDDDNAGRVPGEPGKVRKYSSPDPVIWAWLLRTFIAARPASAAVSPATAGCCSTLSLSSLCRLQWAGCTLWLVCCNKAGSSSWCHPLPLSPPRLFLHTLIQIKIMANREKYISNLESWVSKSTHSERCSRNSPKSLAKAPPHTNDDFSVPPVGVF